MATEKKLGIWMDHASANLMEFTRDPTELTTIESAFITHDDKVNTLSRREKMMHNKEQPEEADYYKKISEAIKDYDEVILFGPTEAKVEFFNLLRKDHHFENIKIEIKQTDKMTENQQHAFVKDHFIRHWV